MKDDLKLAILATLIFLVVVFLWFVGGLINGDLRCLEAVEDRPCIEETVRSDADGECECTTKTGELKWDVIPMPAGCDEG